MAKSTVIFDIDDPIEGYPVLSSIIDKLIKATNIPLQDGSGDISSIGMLTLELKNGQKLQFTAGDVNGSCSIQLISQ